MGCAGMQRGATPVGLVRWFGVFMCGGAMRCEQKGRIMGCRMISSAIFAAGLCVLAPVVWAADATGLWLTGPDDKGQRALVSSKPCGGGALCGTITSVHNSAGAEIDHHNIGVRLFWDMMQQADGTYSGTAFVPALKAKTRGTMQVKGNTLVVRGCMGPICKSQTWSRVR